LSREPRGLANHSRLKRRSYSKNNTGSCLSISLL
jgi:hypothetical protein